MDTRPINDFKIWMARMGYGGKQVSEAGARLNLGRAAASETHRGVRELTESDRKVMSAERVGLPAWTPETDEQLVRLSLLMADKQILDDLAAITDALAGLSSLTPALDRLSAVVRPTCADANAS